VYQVDLENRSASLIDFETYAIRLDIKKTASSFKQGAKHRKEMSLTELRQYLNTRTERDTEYYNTLMEFHKKFSIPIACLALGLLAVPLGIQSSSAKRSFGLVLGLISFLFYYLLLSVGSVFGETGTYPPVIGMWVPNIVMGGLGLYLLIKTAKDNHFRIDSVMNLIKEVKSRLAGYGGP
jgi:lipopolysaccharide export system permease protein